MGSYHDEIHFNLDIVKEEYCMDRENGSVLERDCASDSTEDREEFIEDDIQNGHDDQEIIHFEITEIEQSGSQKKGDSELVSELVCLICEQTFDKLSLLKAHMHTHTNSTEDSTFQCPYCPLVYGYKRFLDEHLQQSHAEESSPEENDSSYLSRFSEPLQTEDPGLAYIEIVKKKGCKDMFKCRACSRIFKKKIHLRNHVTIHTSEKPFVCTICGEAFRRKDYLNIHSTKHTNVNKTCPICKREYSDLECLRRHLNKHVITKATKKGGLICQVCLKVFNNQASYTIHMRKWHPEHPEQVKNKAPPRVTIKKEFPDTPVIKIKHLKLKPKNTYKCIPCNQLFKSRKILTKHERTKRHLQALGETSPAASP
uniref:C2H2-type domain-containing protein n=2 Tax=Phlebotomus papatasi TaxID=29031 RepID=A0A1B0GPP5_PHLPP